MNKLFRIMATMLLCFMWSSYVAFAQFYPNNPPDPGAYYKVTVKSEPENVGWADGGGSYVTGSRINIYAYSRGGYVFEYWTKDGEKYGTAENFEYTVESKNVTFVAHYRYDPFSPNDPNPRSLFTLNLVCEPEGGCWNFSQPNSSKHEVDEWVYLYPQRRDGYIFKGWYEGGSLICNDEDFNFEMPNHNVTLTAKFEYNPRNPGDPTAEAGTDPADNYLYVNDVSATAGGGTDVLVYLQNKAYICQVQYDLYLPEGVSVEKDAFDEYKFSVGSRTSSNRHSFASSIQPDGSLRVVEMSASNARFINSDGDIASIPLVISPDVAPGDYTVYFKNIVLSTPESDPIKCDDTSFTLTVSSGQIYKIGDVDKDGVVDVTDAVIVNDHYIKGTTDELDYSIADVNKDNVVDVSDVVGIIQIYLVIVKK